MIHFKQTSGDDLPFPVRICASKRKLGPPKKCEFQFSAGICITNVVSIGYASFLCRVFDYWVTSKLVLNNAMHTFG